MYGRGTYLSLLAGAHAPPSSLIHGTGYFLRPRLRTLTMLLALLLGLALALGCSTTLAQPKADAANAWPSRPITIVITFGAGSGSDITARFYAKAITEKLGASAVVDIRPGAAGMIGAQYAAKAAPDGYTVLMGSGTVNAANYPLFRDRIPYLPQSFATVALLSLSPAVLYAHKDLRGDSLNELFDSAKWQNRQLSCGSGNAVTQVACEILKRSTGADIVNVPYKGNAQSLTDMASGQIAIAFSDTAAAAPFVNRGLIRPVLVPSAQRLTTMPDVRTAAELGLRDFEFLSWNGIFVPAGTPPQIIRKLNEAARHMLATPEWEKHIEATSGIKVSGDLKSSDEFVTAELAKWERYVRDSGVKGTD